MYTNKEYERFERIGVEKHRSYYIPFAETDKVKKAFGWTAFGRFNSMTIFRKWK